MTRKLDGVSGRVVRCGMLQTLRLLAIGGVLATATLPLLAGEKETLSELTQIGMQSTEAAVIVSIAGSKAPDFTSFTMNEPFRVVVDWAGSKLGSVAPEKMFERGLVRKISTKQFDSEAEKISRVTIELARETSYHVEADGKRVRIHFVPVADPIPEPLVEQKEEQKAEPVKVAEALPEGPLTEPDVAVPSELPPIVKKPEPVVVAVAKKEEPAKIEPAKVEPVAKKEAAPVVVADTRVAPEPIIVSTKRSPKEQEAFAAAQKAAADRAAAEKLAADRAAAEKLAAEKSAADRAVAQKLAADRAAAEKLAADRAAAEKLAAQKVAVPADSKSSAQKNERLASFTPSQPVRDESKTREIAPPSLNTPTSNPQREAAQTTRLASAMPKKEDRSSANVWQPPTVPVKQAATPEKRQLPVVKVAQEGGTLKPTSTMPADADEPVEETPSSSRVVKTVQAPDSIPAPGGDEADPGPRVMKYIGFQQMAEVSRVFVRCDGKAKFRELKEGSTSFVLELVDTSINVKNNERPLDTTYFNTAVQKIQAVKSGSNTRIEVKLRDAVPYKITRIGNTIAIDFSRS